MNSLEKSVVDSVDYHQFLKTLNQMVAIPSLDGSEEEWKVQQLVADIMTRFGLYVETWEMDYDLLAAHPAFSAEVERPRGVGVIGRYGRGDGPTLVLNGHIDVVPAGDLSNWHYPPWQATHNVEEGRVYGRGALDMKGGLCCALYAVKAIAEAKIPLRGSVLIQSVMGEEDGGSGTLDAVLQGHTGDAAIIMEPTELMVAPAQAGCFNFRITIPGRAAHGAMRFEGVDPLEKFVLIYQAILAFEKRRNGGSIHPLFQAYEAPYPICVGNIRAGVWASTVAEELVLEGRYGIKVDEDIEAAKVEFETLIHNTARLDSWLKQNPPVVEWWGGQFEPAEIEMDHAIVDLTTTAFEELTGRRPPVQGMTYGADMRLLVNEGGTPTIMFGPGDVRKAHQPDEYVPFEDLKRCTETLILTILRFCGVQDDQS